MITQHTRRTLLTRIGARAALVGVLAVAGCAPSSSETAATTTSAVPGPTPNLPAGDMSNGAANFYTSERVSVQPVSFKNQYGMNVTGNLFVPNDIDRNAAPAIVVGHPIGAVKEQSANLYATKMAERGFVTMSLDLSFWGASDGQPRNAVSPDIYAEDFSAAVDYLRTQSFVDKERIGALGICGSGSFVISAAKIDPRIKSVATVSMYDMGAANRDGLRSGVTPRTASPSLRQAADQRDVDSAAGDRAHRRHSGTRRPIQRHRPGVLRLLPHLAW
jgi:fermentation-respiration switch protein FrsA (DUF1100 family)